MTVVDLDTEGTDMEYLVAPGITIVHYDEGPQTGRWGIRHACPGIWREDGDDKIYVSAPIIASDLVSEDPLTFSPSILCLGAGLPCGLHGFVVDGRWQDAGTPEETMRHVVVVGGPIQAAESDYHAAQAEARWGADW